VKILIKVIKTYNLKKPLIIQPWARTSKYFVDLITKEWVIFIILITLVLNISKSSLLMC
jgi:hypothetical protein